MTHWTIFAANIPNGLSKQTWNAASIVSVTYQRQLPERKYRLQNELVIFSENRVGKIKIRYEAEILPGVTSQIV